MNERQQQHTDVVTKILACIQIAASVILISNFMTSDDFLNAENIAAGYLGTEISSAVMNSLLFSVPAFLGVGLLKLNNWSRIFSILVGPFSLSMAAGMVLPAFVEFGDDDRNAVRHLLWVSTLFLILQIMYSSHFQNRDVKARFLNGKYKNLL